MLPAIPLGPSAGPAGIAVAPDGKMVYVTDAGAIGTLGHTITPIVVATDRTLRRIIVGPGPQGIAITPNGQRAYVADAGAIVSGQTGAFGSTVTPVDLATGKALPPITVGNAPTGIAITPDGSVALVTNLNSGSVSTIDIANDKAGAPIAVQGAPIAVAISSVQPTIAFVVDAISKQAKLGNVTPINLTTDAAGKPIVVGKNPQAIALSPDGKTAWVVCFGNETIVPVNVPDASPRHGDPRSWGAVGHRRGGEAEASEHKYDDDDNKKDDNDELEAFGGAGRSGRRPSPLVLRG